MATKDKWNHPFFYPTAANAGVSGEGSGFFWQQKNDIFDDNESGMVRLGKEREDVEVINESTGEFEFPFDSGADYFCMEVRQGHKSGGEEHGCEGSCYIFNVKINQNPAKFFWQKQMYHGGQKHRHGSGEFGHTRVTEKVVGNGWKGFSAVIYSKKDGRSAGQNSAILEIWWNEDPVNNPTTGWFMVKRIEDKGGWGSGGNTCNGMSDQVITWSNIQFRFKSGTPDFSLHPRKPEFEDGPVIHSIGEEDMDFAACNRRGYGYREDMPRDVEMKCLFKFDENDGLCHLKNLSLREINADVGFDDTPDVPDEPQETRTISGKFKLQWDINSIRKSECAGGGTTIFYEVIENLDDDKILSNHADHANRTRIAQKVVSSADSIHGKKPQQFDTILYKSGSPTGNISAKIWNASNTVVYTSPTTVDSSTLTTSYTESVFDFSTNTRTLVTGDRIGIEYGGTSNVDFVVAAVRQVSVAGGCRSTYEAGVWHDISSSDFNCRMWE